MVKDLSAGTVVSIGLSSVKPGFGCWMLSRCKMLTVTKMAVIVEADLPPSLLMHLFGWAIDWLITHDLDVICFRADEVYQQSANDGSHTRAEDDDRHLVLARPRIECAKARVEFDIFAEQLNAFGIRGLDAVHHVLESIAEHYSDYAGQKREDAAHRNDILFSSTSTFNCLR